MVKNTAFATKLPSDLTDTLDEVCRQFGLRKNFVVEQALREKIEDLLDTFDLKEAIKSSSGYISWKAVKRAEKGTRS